MMKITLDVQTLKQSDIMFFDNWILQALLLRRQLLTASQVDGYFGPVTRAAVIKYQALNGLTQDGVVGPKTWASLAAVPDVCTDLQCMVRAILEFEEGVVQKVYASAEGGNCTAGIGHKLLDSEVASWPLGTSVPMEQVEKWYLEDVEKHTRKAISWLGETTFNALSPLRQALAICMAYQIGDITLWVGTASHIAKGEWRDVKQHIENTRWYEQTPKRARRMAEMWVTGELLEEYA